MRIDFYWFNVDTPIGWNLGVVQLSGELKARGHDVRLCQVDPRVALPWDPAFLAAHSAARSPEVIALSFASSHVGHARRLVAALREALPTARIVCGGVHVTLAAEDVIAWPGVTAVGLGECDGVFADFIDAWADGADPPGIKNFWVRDSQGRLHRFPLGPLPPLDGMAAFDDALDVQRIVAANRGLVSLSVTRGCPFRCTYCHNQAVVDRYAEDIGRRAAQQGWCRRRRVDDALAEVKRLVRLAGPAARMVSFDDDTLLTDRAWFMELAARLKAEVGLPYLAMGTVDRIDAELAHVLGATGCMLMRFGVESAVPRLAERLLRRVHRQAQTEAAFRLLRAHGVNTRAYILFGIPGETAEDVVATLALCARVETDTVRPAYLQPYPRTAIHAYCVAQDLIRPDGEPTSYFTGSPLRWPPAHELYLAKVMTLFPWLLSAHLPGSPVANDYRQALEDALALDAATWARPETQRALRETTLQLDRDHRRAGVPHYVAPFPDRPDTAFLIRPGRRYPFPNVDDAWPPDAPWVHEPLER